MIIKKNEEIDINLWKDFLKTNHYSSPFATPEFYELYNSEPNYDASVLAIEDQNEIKALAIITLQKEKGIKSYFSRRAIIYGGILFDNTDYIKPLLNSIKKHFKNKSIYTEIRNYFDYSGQKLQFENENWEYINYTDVLIPLKDFQTTDEYIDSLEYNRKREIKLSLKNGAIYREAKNENDVSKLYQILEELYEDRVKLPLPSLSFFQKLTKSEIGKTFVVEHDNQIIGGAFTFYLSPKNMFTFYYCGLRNYHKKIFPTHLAILATVNFALQNNIPYIDLMGAGKADEDYGVRKYKLKFGGELVEYGRFLQINNPLLYNLGKQYLKWKSKQ